MVYVFAGRTDRGDGMDRNPVIENQAEADSTRPDPDGGPYLNDLWRLHPGHERTLSATGQVVSSAPTINSAGTPAGLGEGLLGTARGSVDVSSTLTGGDGLPEGRIVVLAASLNAKPVPNEDVEAAVGDNSGECVLDVSVKVVVAHDCLKELHLTLYGPGPAPYRPPSAGYWLGEGMPGDMPRGEPAQLFIGGSGRLQGTANQATPCAARSASPQRGPEGRRVIFSDAAETSVLDCCDGTGAEHLPIAEGGGSRYINGTFRPLDSLSRYVPPHGKHKTHRSRFR